MRVFGILKGFKIPGAILAILAGFCRPEEAAGPSTTEKQAFEKAMAERMAFEKEKAQQQLARSEEDEKRRLLRQREEERQRLSQAPPLSPPPNPSQAAAHQGGASFASSLQGDVINAAKSSSLHIVPRFQTENPPEASLDAGAIGDAALAASRTNEASQSLASSAKDRRRFTFKPDADPLFVEANQAIENPRQSLNEEINEVSGPDSAPEDIKTCEESGDETLETGEEVRVVTVNVPDRLDKHRVTLTAYSNYWPHGLWRNVVTGAGANPAWSCATTLTNPFPQSLQSRFVRVERVPEFVYRGEHCSFNEPPHKFWGGGWGRRSGSIWSHLMRHMSSLSPDGTFSINTSNTESPGYWNMGPVVLNFDIFYKALPTEQDVSEKIDDNACQHLEERVEKGLCVYENVIVTEGPQTRVIGSYPVTRDWWRRTKVYRCHYPSKNDCGVLRDRGCYQVNSACKEKVGDTCVVWQQTFNCPSSVLSGKSYRSSNKHNPFCLTGDCADTSYPANTELLSVMSHLYVLREAQNDLKNHAVIFKGQHRWCTRNFMDFRDCCGSGRGWGVTLHLSSCDAAEIELRTLRDKCLCVQVGTYCAEKALGVCIRKKTSFCCYGSKIARLIQEHGRAQLGMSFGTPQSPDCNGLSADHLSRIDFARINFSELFEDIRSHTVVKGQQQSLAQVSVDRLRDNMTLLTRPSNQGGTLAGSSTSTLQQLKEKGF